MRHRSRLIHAWRNLLHKSAVERELDDELRAAEETLRDRYASQGMSDADARRAARLALGGEPVQDAVRDVRAGVRLEMLLGDLRYAVRALRKSPAFTAAAVLSLALGIGANAAIFTFINALALSPLPVRDPSALVEIAPRGSDPAFLSFPMHRDLAARQQALTGIVATAGETPVRVTVPAASGGGAEIDNVRISFVTGNYFSVLGLAPAAGRLFLPEDDRVPASAEQAGSIVVLSDAFWQRQFARDPSVIGRTILIGRTAARVVGVTPPGFAGEVLGNAADGWVPLTAWSSLDELENRRGTFTAFFGRLKSGIAPAEAAAQLTVLFRQLRVEEGIQKTPEQASIELLPAAAGLDFSLRRTYMKPLLIVMGMVALVLLIACANIANLLLARSAARAGEIGVRLALGCSRARLVGQLLIESLLLASAGAAAGLLISQLAARSLARMILGGPVGLKLRLDPDIRVFAFLAVLAIATAVIFGLVPALRATRLDLAPALKGAGRAIRQPARQRAGRVLVAAQVALSLLLLVGAGLLVRSVQKLYAQDLGFSPQNVIVFSLAGSPSNRQPEAMAAVERAARERVLAIPGVQSASFSGMLIFSPSDIGAPFSIPGAGASERLTARYNSVSPGYFDTLGMTMLEGRALRDEDNHVSAAGAVVVNESFARRFFPGGAVGRTIRFGGQPGRPLQIVGIVRDAKYNSLRTAAKPLMFVPYAKMTRTLRSLEVRSTMPMASLAGPVREALSSVSKELMIRQVLPLTEQVDHSLSAERLLLRLCAMFAALALLLACIGLYGVVAYSVAHRTAEIGVRVALGATPSSVMRGIVRETLLLAGAGIALGIPAALAAGRLLTSFLYGMTPRDPATFAVSAATLLAAAAVAAALPARRAASVDPAAALRSG
ncbi:MAG TPA: ABC transporter permease [Vicinamibacterales bacterium]|nr:ABC transporter permease [Vicinamibacterales bacterium]